MCVLHAKLLLLFLISLTHFKWAASHSLSQSLFCILLRNVLLALSAAAAAAAGYITHTHSSACECEGERYPSER